MGRSQVLYNRTKGRHRSQGGRGDNTGRGGRGRNEQGGTGSGGRRSRSDANQRDDWKQKTHGNRHSHHHHHHHHQQQHQHQQQSYGSRGRDYEHEYELLLAGRDTTLGSTKHRHRSDLEDDVDNHSPLGGTASICLPSMAATLETLSISRRLRMPLHVAASAFPSRFPRPEESKEEEPPPSSGVDDTVDAAAAAAAAAVDDDDDDDKDDVCADLEDWLDDACGEPEQPGEPHIAEASAVATTSEPSGFQTRNDETANDAPEPNSKIVEEGNDDGDGDGDDDNDNEDDNEDDDNLDDWLDSVIE